jgi:hypothetical protein
MRKAFVKIGGWVRRVLQGVGATVRSNAEELAVGAGLVLITVGLWPPLGISALVVPGAALVYVALPSRLPFVLRPPDVSSRGRK